ncbi:MAG: DUF805 domain-containing protein [Chitinophagales bacterium]|nr:DUF805 domain-containing protein [Hyphomicrobiales bacterium]
MNLPQLLFSFNGRINRKTYWLLIIPLSLAAAALNLALIAIVTGDPFSAKFWELKLETIDIWGPITVGSYILFTWPSLAIAKKRLNDRDRSFLIYIPYFIATFASNFAELSGIKLYSTPGLIAFGFFMIYALWLSVEMGVLRGTPGQNRHGADTLPPMWPSTQQPGLWNWLFGLHGRINRASWWAGFGVFIGCIGVLMLIFVGTFAFFTQSYGVQMENPNWHRTPEGLRLDAVLKNTLAALSIAFLPVLWISIATGVKRLHDQNLTGWLILLVILPIMGLAGVVLAKPYWPGYKSYIGITLTVGWGGAALWCFVQLGVLKGKASDNRHGPDPIKTAAQIR